MSGVRTSTILTILGIALLDLGFGVIGRGWSGEQAAGVVIGSM